MKLLLHLVIAVDDLPASQACLYGGLNHHPEVIDGFLQSVYLLVQLHLLESTRLLEGLSYVLA